MDHSGKVGLCVCLCVPCPKDMLPRGVLLICVTLCLVFPPFVPIFMGVRSLRERGGVEILQKGDCSSRKIMDYIIITKCISTCIHIRTYMHTYVVNTSGVINK